MKDRLLQAGIKTYRGLSRHITFPPLMVIVETTKVCNLRCPGCRRNYKEGSISSEPGPKHLTVEALERILRLKTIRLVRFGGDGEHFCNPHLRDLFILCRRKGVRSAITTNATLLNKDWISFLENHGLVRIHVSFDGVSKETFEKARLGANYEKVVDNCKLLGRSKIPFFLSLVLASDKIVEEVEEYPRLAKKLGATGILVMRYQAESLKQWRPPTIPNHLLEKFRSEVEKLGMIYVGTVTEKPTFTNCDDAYTCPYITLNGDVYACQYMANQRRSEVFMGREFPVPYRNYCMGNINKESLWKIWYSRDYRSLRKFLEETKPKVKISTDEELLALREQARDEERFAYCRSCLCRWGESGK